MGEEAILKERMLTMSDAAERSNKMMPKFPLAIVNKLLQTGGLNTTETYFLTESLISQKSEMKMLAEPSSLQRSRGESLLCLSLNFWCFWKSLVFFGL